MAAATQVAQQSSVVRLTRRGHTIALQPVVPELVIAFRSRRHEPVKRAGA